MFQSKSDTVHSGWNSQSAQSLWRAVDFILVPLRGSIPSTTGGKIRRVTRLEKYRRWQVTPPDACASGLACNQEAAMLITLVAMAFLVSLEPFRIGMTVLMLQRPRPMQQLLAFLCGGFAMGMSVGLVVVFVFRRTLLRSTYFTLPRVQMLIGATALLVAVALVAMDRTRRLGLRPGMLATRIQQLLNGRSLWIAGIAGLGIALPSADYLGALAVISASGATAMKQVGALLAFNFMAFALVEIPLLASLLAPQATHASMAALHNWIRSRRRVEVAILLATVGCVLLAVGSTGI